MYNCKNPFQGEYKKALCLCSAGLLRSPTLAFVLGNMGYNTRAAGVHDYALVQVNEVLIEWADEIYCVEPAITDVLLHNFKVPEDKKVITLTIPDCYPYRDKELIKIIEEQLK